MLTAKNISKSFGPFCANDAISLKVRKGEIHALLGENGAGKSTFVKMLCGVIQADKGVFEWQGDRVDIASPQQARTMGIATVFQHFSLFPALTVLENIALSLPDAPNNASLRRQIIEAEQHWGLEVDPDCPVSRLSAGEQQRVEIMRCFLQDPKLLIMDEPTSLLTPKESQKLFNVLRNFVDKGGCVLYISHKLKEIIDLADKATILRGGRKVGQAIPRKTSASKLAAMMIGKTITPPRRTKSAASSHPSDKKTTPRFVLRDFSLAGGHDFATTLTDINFKVEAGCVLAIAGVNGNGQQELAASLSGEIHSKGQGKKSKGRIVFDGKDIKHLGVSQRRVIGIEYVPEQCLGHAGIGTMPLSFNTFLTRFNHYTKGSAWWWNLFVNPQCAEAETDLITTESRLAVPHADAQLNQLSGGNMQKFVIGRMLIAEPKVVILSQPSKGVDIGAAMMIRKNLLALAQRGCAVILISQDLEEIFSIATHIAVLHQGRLSPSYPAATMTEEQIGLLMGGHVLHQDISNQDISHQESPNEEKLA